MLGGETGNVAGNCHAQPEGHRGQHRLPLHRWTRYNNRGELLGAPQFDTTPLHEPAGSACAIATACCSKAARDPASDMAPLFARPEFDFATTCWTMWKCTSATTTGKPSSRSTSRTTRRPVPSAWAAVTCDDLTWEFNDWYSLQKVGVHNALAQPGSEVYKQWHDRLLSFREGDAPDFGAVRHVFPDPHDRAVSARAGAVHVYPKSPQEIERGRVLLPRGNRRLRARISVEARPTWKRRSRDDDRRAHGRRPQGP